MPSFTYTQIADYVLDQFWGDDSINALIESIRYLAEDVLNQKENETKGVFRSVHLSNDSASASPDHRGAIYFKGATTKYFKVDHALTKYHTNHFLDIKSPHRMKGDTVYVNFRKTNFSGSASGGNSMTADGEIVFGGVYAGLYAPYDGSIVSVSGYVYKTGGIGTFAGVNVHINGAVAVAGVNVPVDSTPPDGGTNKRTYDRGAHTFSEGDFIDIAADSNIVTGDWYGEVGLVFDD